MQLPGLLAKLTGKGTIGKNGYAQWSTPAPWRNEDGIYVGLNSQAWIYRTLELSPIKWEDGKERIGISRQLSGLLADIGQLSKEPLGGIRALSFNREIHLESITWQEILTSPEENSPALVEFQSEAYGVTVPRRALFFGVKLVPSVLGKRNDPEHSTIKSVQELIKRSLAEDIPPLDLYKDDIEKLERIFSLHGAKIPSTEEFNQLDSWFNDGQGADVIIEELVDRLIVADSTPIQLSAIRTFERERFTQPDDQWIMDTLSHAGDAPHLISLRAELEPPASSRSRVRASQRRIQANIEEEDKSGDLSKIESSETFQLARDFENYLAGDSRPMLSNCSILMASEITDEAETYIDFLDINYGIQMTPLLHRQILAVDETLPTSNTRVVPWLQDVNIPMIAAAGFQAFSQLGDKAGCFAGFVDPDGSPLFIDPTESSRQNLPPAFGVFGDSGSGKSSPINTPVMTPDGIITMGDLEPGMKVLNHLGEPTLVESIHPQGVLKTYEVTLADGRTLETSDHHLWHVATTDNPHKWENRELKTFMHDIADEEGNARYLVPVPRPSNFTEKETLLDPYLAGAISAAGEEAGYTLGMPKNLTEDMLREVTDITLYGVIAPEYIIGSIPQREAFLQGVLDANGTVKDGLLVAQSLHPLIARQLQALIWSLGGVAMLNNEAGVLTDVIMELPEDIEPLRAKKNTLTYDKSELSRFILPIVNIQETEETEHVCITVNDPMHLYISGDFVVSHNTFFAQNFATQCVLSGLPVFFINPKAGDPLDGMVDYINEYTTATASKVSMRAAEQEPGAFDPFFFATDAVYAAEIAAEHILAALDTPSQPMDKRLRLHLASGLRYGAEAGAQCVWDALDYITDPEAKKELKEQIQLQMDASPLFALGVAKEPRDRQDIRSGHLTLIHFDRNIGLPTGTDRSQYTISERIAISAVNLVTKAALEVLIASKGGVLVLDEAWTFLSQPDAHKYLERLSREGRSLNIVPVFLTQKIKDVISSELAEFMSRVLVLKLNTEVEATAAFKICGLEPTEDRLEMLRHAGPVPPKDGKPAVWAQGMFRDLYFKHSWVALGPTPEQAMKSWSTNPEDKRRYEEEKAARARVQEEIDREVEALEAARPIESYIPVDAQAVPSYVSPEHDETVPVPAKSEPVVQETPETPVVEDTGPGFAPPVKEKPDQREDTKPVFTPPAQKTSTTAAEEPAIVMPPAKEATMTKAPAEEPIVVAAPVPEEQKPQKEEKLRETPHTQPATEETPFTAPPAKKSNPTINKPFTTPGKETKPEFKTPAPPEKEPETTPEVKEAPPTNPFAKPANPTGAPSFSKPTQAEKEIKEQQTFNFSKPVN